MSEKTFDKLSIIMPAKNEARSLEGLLPDLFSRFPEAEIIVVNDGSEDDTVEICKKYPVRLITHPYSKVNGASIKSGAKLAKGDYLLFMDADGQHMPDDIEKLLTKIQQGYDMVVGQRDRVAQASMGRGVANMIYNSFASMMTGHPIGDLTSGFRIVSADKFRQFLYLLPNGFSYPTTITMAFFRAGYSVAYLPVNVQARIGKSHLRPWRDGARFLLIIFRVGTLYSPLKVFAPASLVLFLLGSGYYAYTYMTQYRFTNMSALLFITAVMVFLIGLVSEQVTTLIYSRNEDSEK